MGRRIVATPAPIFERIETWFFYGLGALLAVAALVSFLQALYWLIVDVVSGASVEGIVIVLDRVLLVLMLIEVLYTVRISMQSREIRCQPFLVIGLIAAIRRVLVVTLQASLQNAGASPGAASAHESAGRDHGWRVGGFEAGRGVVASEGSGSFLQERTKELFLVREIFCFFFFKRVLSSLKSSTASPASPKAANGWRRGCAPAVSRRPR